MKRAKNLQNCFDSIDRGLVEEIVERVTSSSFTDLINLRLSCKLLNDIGSQQWVYGKLSLQEFHINPWVRLRNVRNIPFIAFMDKSIDCGNTKAMYQKDAALELIHKASKGGHGAVKYAFGIISICLGGVYKEQGVKTIGEMKVTKEQREITWEYRRRFQEMKESYFVLNPIFDNKPSSCCTIKNVPLVRKSGWDSADDEEDEHCYACSSDEEIRQFAYYY
ncbi:putative F-box protein At1g67623 [Solanum verrucosum]|uniref:putative F-box protein At1g67623 n=1 Tax=Solanum verrucosum TaxID=315347 RepID=UPI0020D176EE|nr:putative F-box protein At1g67623 [Solanum verrucosum]